MIKLHAMISLLVAQGLSQPDCAGTLVAISLLKLYSNEVIYLGPGPLQRSGTVAATHWKGRETNPSTKL
jgi:hypothetical protein